MDSIISLFIIYTYTVSDSEDKRKPAVPAEKGKPAWQTRWKILSAALSIQSKLFCRSKLQSTAGCRSSPRPTWCQWWSSCRGRGCSQRVWQLEAVWRGLGCNCCSYSVTSSSPWPPWTTTRMPCTKQHIQHWCCATHFSSLAGTCTVV